MTLLVDVDHPESQKVLVSSKLTYNLVDDASLGLQFPLPALAALTCLSPVGDGLGPQPASSAQSFVL